MQGEHETEMRALNMLLITEKEKPSNSDIVGRDLIAIDKLVVATALPLPNDKWNLSTPIRVCLPASYSTSFGESIVTPFSTKKAKTVDRLNSTELTLPQPASSPNCDKVLSSSHEMNEVDTLIVGSLSTKIMGVAMAVERPQPHCKRGENGPWRMADQGVGIQVPRMQRISTEWVDELSRLWDPEGVILWIDCEGLRWEGDCTYGTAVRFQDRWLLIATGGSAAFSQDPANAKLRLEMPGGSENVDQIGYQKAGLLMEVGLGTLLELKGISIAWAWGRGYTPSQRCSGTAAKGEPWESWVWDPGGGDNERTPKESKSLGRHHTISQEVNLLAGKGRRAEKVSSRGREHFGFVLVCGGINLFRCFSLR